MLLGVLSDPLWGRNYTRLVRKREAQGGEPGGSEPEFRLPPTIVGAILVPIGLFGKLVPGYEHNGKPHLKTIAN